MPEGTTGPIQIDSSPVTREYRFAGASFSLPGLNLPLEVGPFVLYYFCARVA